MVKIKFKAFLSAFIFVLCLSFGVLCSFSSKADTYSNDDLIYLSTTDFTLSDYWNYYFNNKSFNTYSDWAKPVNVNSSDSYVYYVINTELFDYQCNYLFVAFYSANNGSSFYLTETDNVKYFGSYTFCDYDSLDISSLPYSNDYFIFDTITYFNSLNFDNYCFGYTTYGFKLFYLILDFPPNTNSVIFKLTRNQANYMIGNPLTFSNSLPYLFVSNLPVCTSDSYYQNGYNIGYDDGFNTGYLEGSNDVGSISYQNGYSVGYAEGLSVSSADYGFKDLIFNIFDIPLMMLENLFSFTIFDTLAWSFIATVIMLAFVVWLLRKFLK